MKLKEISELTGACLVGDPELVITGVSDLETATQADISFLANGRYMSALKRSNAGAIFVPPSTPQNPQSNYLLTDDPSKAFQQMVEYFHGNTPPTGFLGIHPTAIIHKTAKVDPTAQIGPYTVIDQDVIIEKNVMIGSHVFIGPLSHIKEGTHIHPGVIIREKCTIGQRVIIQPGAIIGSCGFGYLTDEKGVHTKLKQVGTVIIEDDVEVGANTTIDRGRFKETRIRKGSKIDNLVQIGHNVDLGEHNLIVAQVGIAGSSKTGRHVIMGGQSALIGHLKIADGTLIAARGAASKSVEEPGQKFAGAPMIPLGEHNKQSVYLRNIEKYIKRIEALEAKVKELEDI